MPMSRGRDTQRSKVYAWERRAFSGQTHRGGMSLEACDVMIRAVWMKERGRYGLANRPAPTLYAGRGGGRASWHGDYIKLGVWARQPRVILHEIAHCLDPGTQARGGPHGPRFVGILIGLFCRHLGMDRDELTGLALDMRVRFDLRSIGAVPDFGWHRKAEAALERMGGKAVNLIELAAQMGVGYRTAWGACLTLLRDGRIRRRGKAIVLVARAEVSSEADQVL